MQGARLGEEAVIRHQHLQSRDRKRNCREMLSSLTVCDKLQSAPWRRHPALPCPPGTLPSGKHPSPVHTGSCALLLSHWKCLPWFPVSTNCQGCYRNPQVHWLAGGVSQQGSGPIIGPSLPLAVGKHCTWMEKMDRQKPVTGLESYS